VSNGSGSRLPDRKGSDATMYTMAPDPQGGLWCTACPAALDPASLRGGLWALTCPTVLYGPRASSIKKSLAGLPMHLGSHVSNAHVHGSKAPDVWAIMGLQDMQAGTAINVYKMHRQAAIVWLQCSAGPVDHSSGIATVPGDPTARHHAADRVRRGRMMRKGMHHAVEL
jgi:hypothetical protein